MQSRRDLVHAYQFSMSRLVTALTTGEPGKGQSPFRRAGLGLLIGTILAVVACGGIAVYGLINPATSTSWRTPGAIVVRKDTGTRFVYLGGELHPVANLASALLASGSSVGVQYESAASLAGVPDGPAVGIVGAPDTLPAASALLPARWALCLDPARESAVVVDLAPGTPAEVPPDDRLLVAGHGGDYVVWDNVKFPVRSKAVLIVLGLGDATPVQVPEPWLDALPTGPRLAAAPVPGAGHRGPVIAGVRRHIGDLFVTTAVGVQQYYELRRDGLTPISRTEFALQEAVPSASRPVQLSAADVAAAPASADKSLLTSVPDMLGGDVYVYQQGGQALCVMHGTSAQSGATATETLVAESAGAVSQTPLIDGSGAVVPTGDGILAVAPPADSANVTSAKAGSSADPGQGAKQEYLITDTGEKYPLADGEAASALGYGNSTADVLPEAILRLIPTGPLLSQGAAREAVTWPTN